MEHDITPLPSYSHPPLDGDSDDGVGSEDEFGAFAVGGVCSTFDSADVTETHRPERARPEDSGSCDPEASLRYLNGHAGEDLQAGVFGGSTGRCPTEETGFADFALFTEQVGHPWCCGFSERWNDKAERGHCSVDKTAGDLGREVVMDSEPRSQQACKVNGGVCVEGEHCQKSDAALVQPPQDCCLSQGDEGNIPFGSAEESPNIPGNAPTSPQALDDWSLEGSSAELEPNIVTLTTQDGQSERDGTDEMEVTENCGDSHSLFSSSVANSCLFESETDVHQRNPPQETSATSRQPHSGTFTQEMLARFTDVHAEHPVELNDTGVQSPRNLRPSDSFADFCSAPDGDDEEEPTWADFTEQSAPRTFHGEPIAQEEWEESEEDGVSRTNRCQASLSCHVQQLLRSSFPEIRVPAVGGDEDPPNLGSLLYTQQPQETEEMIPELSHALRIQQLMLSPPEDIHCSLGLQFKWGGSHSNTTLLSCLGVDPRNIVFMGSKRQAASVPAYASSLGMLNPTKDPLCSPGPAAFTAPLEPLETQKPSVQDWSCRGLSSPQEGTSPCRAPHP